jgi:hypothetical protein
MSIVVKNPDGQLVELGSSAVALGIGTSRVGRQLEVAGVILARSSEDVGGTAMGFSVEAPNMGHILINGNFDPDQPTKNNKRVLTIFGGNVGIGTAFDVNNPPTERLIVQGNIVVTGDVRLEGADCAEEFAIEDEDRLEPGTVMVIADNERLRQCIEAYDTRVAGVCSGAGAYRPGIILGRQPSAATRMPVALAGRVYCRVDAEYAPIGIGDLLTTSSTRGHAMKALDAHRACGAVLGKALRPLTGGRGLIPVLVSLQ